jgi:excinuclease ABC subunit C
MAIDPSVERKIRSLPDRPGIYIFKDKSDRALYIGKAASLRKRVQSYLSSDHEPRLAVMIEEARDIEVVVTDTEAEALLLENNWIKRNRPRYNILLRDDKTYPYVVLTTGDEFPRVALTRRLGGRGREYFGPYLPGGLARKAIKLVQKLFEIRVCRIEVDGSLPRPCLYYDMKRCLGPCVDGLTSKEKYDRAARSARLFLLGRNQQLIKEMKVEMRQAAARLEFEQAGRIRDLITEVESVSQRRKLSSVHGEDVDVYGIHVKDGNAAVCILVMRGGQVLDRREIFWEGRQGVSKERVLSELLPQIYDRTSFIPRQIHLPMPIDGEEALSDWLSNRKDERVYLRLPSRGPKAQRVALANRNAELAFRRRFRETANEDAAIRALQDHLGLTEIPRRIEGFDISNLQGKAIVASLVVWEEGSMRKSEYRSFNIRGLADQDDFAAMRQAVQRRYKRRLEEVGAMPDLILIDGGRGQLNAALEALAELEVEETPLVALAKKEEELYLAERPEPLQLARHDPGLQLLQRVRDEAHRFAVSKHRRRRSAAALRGKLEEIDGIGPGRRKILLKSFGSVASIQAARLDEIQRVLGPRIGQRIYDHLHIGELEGGNKSHTEAADDPVQ